MQNKTHELAEKCGRIVSNGKGGGADEHLSMMIASKLGPELTVVLGFVLLSILFCHAYSMCDLSDSCKMFGSNNNK